MKGGKKVQESVYEYADKAKNAVANYDIVGLLPNIDTTDLIATIIGEFANELICMRLKNEGLRNLLEFSIEDFKRFGLNEEEAIRLHASFLLTKKVMAEPRYQEKYIIRCPEDAFEYLDYLKYEKQENFVVLYLDNKNTVIRRSTIFIGSLNSVVVHPREVFKEAIRLSSASILVAHNHTTGDATPSVEEISLTKRLINVGKEVGIEVLDHVIVGDKFISLKEKGYI